MRRSNSAGGYRMSGDVVDGSGNDGSIQVGGGSHTGGHTPDGHHHVPRPLQNPSASGQHEQHHHVRRSSAAELFQHHNPERRNTVSALSLSSIISPSDKQETASIMATVEAEVVGVSSATTTNTTSGWDNDNKNNNDSNNVVGISISTSISGSPTTKQQTRFSFYNAQDFVQQPQEVGEEGEGEEPQRRSPSVDKEQQGNFNLDVSHNDKNVQDATASEDPRSTNASVTTTMMPANSSPTVLASTATEVQSSASANSPFTTTGKSTQPRASSLPGTPTSTNATTPVYTATSSSIHIQQQQQQQHRRFQNLLMQRQHKQQQQQQQRDPSPSSSPAAPGSDPTLSTSAGEATRGANDAMWAAEFSVIPSPDGDHDEVLRAAREDDSRTASEPTSSLPGAVDAAAPSAALSDREDSLSNILDEDDPPPPHRFNFYNAQEISQAAASSSVPAAAAATTNNNKNSNTSKKHHHQHPTSLSPDSAAVVAALVNNNINNNITKGSREFAHEETSNPTKTFADTTGSTSTSGSRNRVKRTALALKKGPASSASISSSSSAMTESHVEGTAAVASTPSYSNRTNKNRYSSSVGTNEVGEHAQSTGAASPTPDLDCSEILRSLQEHEQQRLGILGGSASRNANATKKATETGSATAKRSHPLQPRPSSARRYKSTAASTVSVEVHSDDGAHAVSAAAAAATDSYHRRCQDNNKLDSTPNPYEDAIRDALELLRRHRSSTSASSSSRPVVANAAATTDSEPTNSDLSTAAAPSVDADAKGARVLLKIGNTTLDDDEHLNELQRQFHELTPDGVAPPPPAGGRNRHFWGDNNNHHAIVEERLPPTATDDAVSDSLTSLSRALQTTAEVIVRTGEGEEMVGEGQTEASSSAASSNGGVAASTTTAFMGDTYQSEIEIRRRQRQERMAKYATRLAELKKEDALDQEEAAKAAAAVAPVASSSSAAAVLSPATHGNPDQRHPLQLTVDTTAGAVIPGTDEATVTSSAWDADVNTLGSAALPTQEDSTAPADQIQRGVERVLMAILERAGSNVRGRRGEGSVDGELTGEDPSSDRGSPPLSLSWQQGEEKKSAQLADDHDVASSSSAQEDSLVQAMSDLLGGSSSSRGSISTSDDGGGSVSQSSTRPPRFRGGAGVGPTSSSQPPMDRGFLVSDTEKDSRSVCSEPDRPREHFMATEVGVEAVRSEAVRSDPGGGITGADHLDEMVKRVFRGRHDDYGIVDGSTAIFVDSAGVAVGDSCHHDEMVYFKQDSGTPTNEVTGEDADVVVEHRPRDYYDDDDGETESDDDVDDEEEDYDDDDDDDEEEADDSIENSSVGMLGSDETEEDEDDVDDHANTDTQTLDGVLGPLSKKAGGTTGVVLEADPPSESSKISSPSILESLSAAIDIVTGAKSKDEVDDDDEEDESQTEEDEDDKYVAGYDEADDDCGGNNAESDTDSEAMDLMMALCAHLLPPGVAKQSARILDQVPSWDEANPDEPGYRIVRLSSTQLRRVEREYERFNNHFRRRKVSEQDGITTESDRAFDRDLQAAEKNLDGEENDRVTPGSTAAAAIAVEDEQPGNPNKWKNTTGGHGCLPNFPGVRPAGKGEMGDLEFYYLPVIFKSHVTGFEPTKDLYLEAGNVVAGQYLVQGEIGSAAFSTAYRCVDLNSEGDGPDGHDEVCLKVIKNTKDFFDQSLDEIKILELLRQTGRCHENYILEMKTFFYHREHLIIVTELLRQNLFEFGKFILDNNEEPYFTLPRLAYITRQCLVALDFTHKVGLVHSDVKPENILLSSYSRAQIKLIDFGSSCFLTDRQSSYIQSRSYRAPEVILGLPYDGRIDVWSLGCVVAEMFTGEVTFQNDSIVSMLSRIEAICGRFPSHMINQGRQSARFFTRSGLLYEKVEPKAGDSKESTYAEEETEYSSDDDHHQDGGDRRRHSSGNQHPQQQGCIDLFQPKRTHLALRLGIDPELIERYDAGMTLPGAIETRKAEFVDFVRSLLMIDPDQRPSASQALQHPWIRDFAASLTESDVKYPSS